MRQPVLAFLVAIICQTPLMAAPAFELNDLPSFMAPLKWGMTVDEVSAHAYGSRIESNNYSAEYFGKVVRVEARIFTQSDTPYFGEAQISLERFEGKLIGIRINTTDLDPKCWDGEGPFKRCRKADHSRLHKTFLRVKSALETQYGPGIVKNASSDREPSIQWHGKEGDLMLFLHREEFDDWTVGLWAARR